MKARMHQRDQQEQECTCNPPAATAADSDSVSLHDLVLSITLEVEFSPRHRVICSKDFLFAVLARCRLYIQPHIWELFISCSHPEQLRS